MAMRLDPDLRALVELAQQRRREAAPRVTTGKLKHLNYISREDCLMEAGRNLVQIQEKEGEAALIALADTINYGLAAAGKEMEESRD